MEIMSMIHQGPSLVLRMEENIVFKMIFLKLKLFIWSGSEVHGHKTYWLTLNNIDSVCGSWCPTIDSQKWTQFVHIAGKKLRNYRVRFMWLTINIDCCDLLWESRHLSITILSS